GGSAAWLRHQYLAEVAETNRRREIRELAVNNDLREAADLQALGKWTEAQAVLERAQGRVAGHAPEDLRQQVAQMHAGLAMVIRLEQIRLEKSDPNEDGDFDFERADRAYARAFQEYDLDVLALPPDEAAARIKSAAIQEQLDDALGDWACSVPYDEKRRELLISLARLTDTDAFRQQIWDAVLRQDQKALERLTTQPEVEQLSPAGCRLLGEAL